MPNQSVDHYGSPAACELRVKRTVRAKDVGACRGWAPWGRRPGGEGRAPGGKAGRPAVPRQGPPGAATALLSMVNRPWRMRLISDN